MPRSRTSEGTLVRCPVCGRKVALEPPVAALQATACPRCANALSLEGAASPSIKLAAFPILDERTMRILDRLRRWLAKSQPAQLELDFRGVKFLSSAALGKLITLAKTAQGFQSRIVLRNLEPVVKEVLDVTRTRDLFHIQA